MTNHAPLYNDTPAVAAARPSWSSPAPTSTRPTSATWS